MNLETLVKFNSQTNARDKLCRLLQYTSKLAWYIVQQRKLREELIQHFKTLENSFSATRKVMRLGKSIDLAYGAYKSLLIKDGIIKLTLFAAKINQAVYLVADHYIWLIKLGIVKGDAKAWGKTAAKFWLVTIIFNLMRNFYDVFTILTRPPEKLKENGHSNRREVTNLEKLLANKPVVVDTVKNCCDVLLPMSGVGYVDVNVGLQGILGMLTSVLAMLPSWDPKYKLIPA